MERSEIVRTLLERGAERQQLQDLPPVGSTATTDFFQNFEAFNWPLGNTVLSGNAVQDFSHQWLSPDTALSVTWDNSYVPGRDVGGVRRLASDRISLLIDASDPNGELFVPDYDDRRGEVARATGVGLWDWLERLAGLLLASPDADLSFESEIPGNRQFEAAIWFEQPWEVIAVLDVDEIVNALTGAGRFGRDLPKMAEPEWVAQTFGGCPVREQLKLVEALDLLWSGHPLIANERVDVVRSRGFELEPQVRDALAKLNH